MAELPRDTIYHYESKDGLNITVTMTPLVRCKDCKYRYGDKDQPYCDRINPYRSFYVGDNDFCSWGEKNGKNNDRT